MESKSKRFEKLVAKIQSDFSKKGEVKHDEKVMGRITKSERQVDVSVRSKSGQFDVFVAIECKDWKVPIDSPEIESFIQKMDDIGADRGAMVAANGFTEGAKNLAKNKRIQLFRLVDAEKHDWTAIVSIGSLYQEIHLDSYQFIYSSTGGKGFGISAEEMMNPRGVIIYNESDKAIGTVFELFAKAWNSGKLPDTEGQHSEISLIDIPTKKRFRDEIVSVKVQVSYQVSIDKYHGFWPTEELRGFKDEITGVLITKKIKTSKLSYEEIKKTWKKINNLSELDLPPEITLTSKVVIQAD